MLFSTKKESFVGVLVSLLLERYVSWNGSYKSLFATRKLLSTPADSPPIFLSNCFNNAKVVRIYWNLGGEMVSGDSSLGEVTLTLGKKCDTCGRILPNTVLYYAIFHWPFYILLLGGVDGKLRHTVNNKPLLVLACLSLLSAFSAHEL